MAKQDGDSETAQDAVARAFNNIAMVERSTPDRLPNALATYQQVLKIYQGLTDKRPASAKFQEGLARTYLNLGEVDDHLKKPDEAVAAYRSAMEHQRRAVELEPQDVGFRERLLAQCGELAAIHRRFSRPSDALAIGLEQKQLAAGNAQALFEAGRSLALTAAAIGTPDAKLPDDKQAERTRAASAAVEAIRDAIAAGLKDVPQRLSDPDLRHAGKRSGVSAICVRNNRDPANVTSQAVPKLPNRAEIPWAGSPGNSRPATTRPAKGRRREKPPADHPGSESPGGTRRFSKLASACS